jgi:aspartate aminotransferase
MIGANSFRAGPAGPPLVENTDPMNVRSSIEALPNSMISEIVNHGRERPGLIPLWLGEGDLPTPSFIADACDRAIRDGHVFYTWQHGLPELRRSLSGYLERVYGVPVDTGRITVHGSGMTAIMLSLQALIDPGDEVVVVSPVWPNIFSAVRILGGEVRMVPLELTEAGWGLDLDRLFDACSARTRMIFVNSPNNPTGWTMKEEELRAVLDFARSRGLWVMADEVYSRLVYDAPHAPSMLPLLDPEDRVVVVNSFSKNWAMTGWRLGWTVAPALLAPHYEKLVQFNNSGTPAFIQMAGIAAIEQGEPFIAQMVERCRRGRDIVCDALGNLPDVRLTRPEGAFYAFFAVDGVTDSLAFAKRIVDETDIGMAPGAAFGSGGEGCLRLCFASTPERLEEAMSRLVPFFRRR